MLTQKNMDYQARALADELAYRREVGTPEYTMAELMGELNRLGYRLDRSSDCASWARWVSGPREGKSYPCTSLYILESDTGKSFAESGARRDKNFDKLQALRKSGAYVAGRRTIFEI